MSIPTKATTFGTITVEGEKYDLFSIPFGDQQNERINQYKKEHKCGSSSAPWKFNRYHWEISDNKLYLISMSLGLCPEPQISRIQDIFSEDKVFASWTNREIKALVRVIEDKMIDDRNREIIRDVMIMELKDGILINTKQETETVRMRVLKNYIEE